MPEDTQRPPAIPQVPSSSSHDGNPGNPGERRRAVVITLGPERGPQQTLFRDELFNGQNFARDSRLIPTRGFNRFAIYLFMDSAGVGVHEIQIFPVFSSDITREHHALAQGIFATLTFDDVVTATGLARVFTGDVAGDHMGVRIVPTGTTSALTFTITAEIQLIRDI